MSEIQIPEISCQNHGALISFLDLNKDVLIGQRVLCHKCHLMSPTNIQDALKQYKSYNDNQINIFIERQDQLSCAPILKIKQQLQNFQKIMNSQLEKILTAIGDLCQIISEEKSHQISQLLQSSQNLNLSKLKDIAQILSEEINLKNYFSTSQNIINQFQNLQTQLAQFDKTLNEFSNETQEMIEVVLPEKLQFYEANVLIQEGKSKEALNQLNRYLKENNYLHSSSLILRGQLLLATKDYDEAIDNYDKVLVQIPNQYDALICKGYSLYKLQCYEEAMVQYNNIEIKDPDIEKLKNIVQKQRQERKNMVYKQKNSKKKSISRQCWTILSLLFLVIILGYFYCFNQVIKIDSKSIDAYYHKGLALEGQNLFEEAYHSFNYCIQQNQDYSEAKNSKGIKLSQIKKYFEKIISYRDNLNKDPNNAVLHYNIGNKPLCKSGYYLDQMRLFEEAIKSLDSAIKINPNYSEAYNNKGIALINLNQYEEAIKSYDSAIKINPNYSEAYNKKGIALFYLNQYEEAIKSYDSAIKLNPNNSEAYNNKGIALERLKIFEEAIKSYDSAIKINPNYSLAHSSKCNLLLKMHRSTEDTQCNEQAILIDSSNAAYEKKGFNLYTYIFNYLY